MLRLVDYVDGLMVVDKNCIIRHFYTAYPDLVNLRQDEPLNRSLFEIYPTLKREDSYICRALRQESFINYEQTYINYKGDAMESELQRRPHQGARRSGGRHRHGHLQGRPRHRAGG